MAEGNAPTDAKAHESGLLPVGASLEDAAMVKPAVCPITSTYNFTYEGEEVLLDPSSRTFGLSCWGWYLRVFPRDRRPSNGHRTMLQRGVYASRGFVRLHGPKDGKC